MKKSLLGAIALGGLLMLKSRSARASSLKGPDYLTLPAFTRFDELFRFYSSKHGVSDWRWVKAIATVESALGEAASVKKGMLYPLDTVGSASSDKKSWGVMQTTLPTARDMRPGVSIPELNDPETSIDLGTKYFAWLLRRYEGSVEKAVQAYNQGPGNTDKGFHYADDYLRKWKAALQPITERQFP